jgi:uncharacterized protein
MSPANALKKLRDFVAKHYHTLVQLHDTPHSIAGGVSIGIFVGFLPLFIPFVPLKYTLSVLTSWLFRCSKVAALIAVTAHDILLPIWPLVLRWEYQIGYWLLHHQLPPRIREGHVNLRPEYWFSMKTFRGGAVWFHHTFTLRFFTTILPPMLIGSVIIGVPVAAICYMITLRVVTRTQASIRQKESRKE